MGAHIGARALLDINLIWSGYIARLSQWGGVGCFTLSNDFCLRLEGMGSAPCDITFFPSWSVISRYIIWRRRYHYSPPWCFFPRLERSGGVCAGLCINLLSILQKHHFVKGLVRGEGGWGVVNGMTGRIFVKSLENGNFCRNELQYILLHKPACFLLAVHFLTFIGISVHSTDI